MPVEITVRRSAVQILKSEFPRKLVLQVARKLLSTMECKERVLSVLITDDVEIAELNGRYRKKPKPTDVLSFPAGDIPLPHAPLGDLVISIETAKRQADERNLSLPEEVLRLMIHGTLHLLGYDHEGVPPAEAKIMRREEDRLYGELLSALPNITSSS